MDKKTYKILTVENGHRMDGVKALITAAFPDSVRISAPGCKTGMELAAAVRPDIVLIWLAPGTDGLGVCRRLKTDAELSGTPVVFVTPPQDGSAGSLLSEGAGSSENDRGLRGKALETGADAFLSVTADKNEVTRVIGALLQNSAPAENKAGAKKRTKKILREQADLFQTIFERMPGAAAVYRVLNGGASGADYIIEDFNETALKIEHKQKKDVLGKSLRDLVPGIDGSGLIEQFQKVYKTGKSLIYPAKVFHFHGDESRHHWFENHIFKLPGGQVATIFNDVTERYELLEQLDENRVLVDSVINGTTDAIFMKDPEGRYLLFNHAAEKITGKTAAEALGKDDFFLFPEEEARAIKEDDRNVLEKNRTVTHEETITDASGKALTVLSTKGPVYKKDGTLHGLYGITRNISGRKELEKQLRQKNDDLTEAQHISRLGMWRLDTATGQVTWSGELLEIFGFDPKGPSPSFEERMKVYTQESRERLAAAFTRIKTDGTPFELELEITKPDGSHGWVWARSEAVKDNNGKITDIRTVLQDVTGRRQTEEALRESEIQYRNLADTGMALIWRSDAEKSCYYFNKIWLEFTGRTLAQEIGNGWAEGVHPDDYERCLNTYVTAFDKREKFEMEYRLRHHSGAYRWILDLGTPNYNVKGEFIGYIGHCFDITGRKKAEQALAHSHELMRCVIENSNGAVAIHDKELRYIYVSQRYLDDYKLKLKAEDVIGKHHYEVFPDLPQKWRDAHQKALAGVVTKADEDAYPRADGALEWTRWECRPWYEADGSVGGIIVYTEVITARKQAELALAESRENLAITLNSIGDGVISTDIGGKIVSMNPVAEKLCGCRLSEAAGRPLTDVFRIVNADTRLPVDGPVEEVMKTGQTKGLANHTVLISKDGAEYQISDSAAPIKDREGKTIGVVLVFSDVTEKYEAEQALRESEQRYKVLHDASFGGLVIHDRKRILECNQGLSKITGYSYEELIGMEVLLLIAPESRETAAKHVGEDFEKPYEALGIRKNGELYPARIEARMVPYKGKTVRSVEFRDITEQKQAERALRESEQRYKALHNASFGGIGIHDKGLILECNQGLSEMTGYPYEELIGMDGLLLIDPDFRALVIHHIETDYEKPYEVTGVRKNGERYPVRLEARVVPYKGKKVRSVEFRDITEQRQAERALRESEQRYRSLFEYSGVGIGYYTTDGVVISYNHKALERNGGKPEDFVGKSIHELFTKEQAELYLSRIQKAANSAKLQQYEDCVLRDSKPEWYSSIYTRVSGPDGNVLGVQVSLTDITEKKLAQESISRQNELLATLLKLLPVGVFMADAQTGKPLAVNDKGRELLGRGVKPDANGNTLSEDYKAYKAGTDIPYPNEELPISLGMKGIGSHIEDMEVERPDGSRILLEVFGTPVKDAQGKLWASLITFTDITARKQSEMNLIHMSSHDVMTGLYNRRYFESILPKLDTPEKLPLSVIVFDINGLKLVNDSFGHEAGDLFIVKAANAIQSACRPGDVAARTGGDEFVLLLPATKGEDALHIGNAIKDAALKETVSNVGLSLSYGYATKENPGQSLNDVMANAENYMYRYKLYENAGRKSDTISVIMKALFEKSPREEAHSRRVSAICKLIAAQLNFSEDDVNKMGIAGLLHDIGKIGTEEKILNKPEPLTPEERKEMEKHAEASWRILSSSVEFKELAKYILHHHESWSGGGYPQGVKGQEIPLEARIITLADSYDAMTNARSYKPAMSREAAIAEIVEKSGIQFDPELVDLFLNLRVDDSKHDTAETEKPEPAKAKKRRTEK